MMNIAYDFYEWRRLNRRNAMKLWKILFAFALTVSYLSLSFAEEPLEGNWMPVDEVTGEKRAVLHFEVKDGILTGTIATVFPKPGDTGICSACPGEFKDKPIKGLQIVWGLKKQSNGVWDGGRILDAQSGKIYNVKMSLKGNKLLVRGYIGLSWIGRTQTWERASSL